MLIFILIFVIFSKFYLKKDIIKFFGSSPLIVVTGSMEPTIHIKEFIIIKEMENYKVNDIVTYKNNENNFVTHRIVEKNEDTIITRGDNNTINDEPIKVDNIEGKVVFHSIVLGELFLYWLKPIMGLLFIVSTINFIKYSIVSRKVKTNNEEIN